MCNSVYLDSTLWASGNHRQQTAVVKLYRYTAMLAQTRLRKLGQRCRCLSQNGVHFSGATRSASWETRLPPEPCADQESAFAIMPNATKETNLTWNRFETIAGFCVAVRNQKRQIGLSIIFFLRPERVFSIRLLLGCPPAGPPVCSRVLTPSVGTFLSLDTTLLLQAPLDVHRARREARFHGSYRHKLTTRW